MSRIITFAIALFLFVSCNDQQVFWQLKNLDAMLEDQSEIVLDSLKKIDVSRLNASNRAYYHLLNASAMDKNLIHLNQDSTLKISEAHYQKKEDYYNLARTQYYLAKYIGNQDDRKEEAYDLFKQAEISFNQTNGSDHHLIGLIYYQMASLSECKNSPLLEDYAQKSYEEFKISEDTVSMCHALKLSGLIYASQREYQKAEDILIGASKLINPGKTPKEWEAKAGILTSLSSLYRKMNDYEKALKSSREALILGEKLNKNKHSSYFYNITTTFLEQGQIDSAKHYCYQLISSATENKRLVNLINGYKIMAEITQKEGNYQEACQLKDIFNSLKDSLNLTTSKNKLLEVERKYNVAEKEKIALEARNELLQTSILSGILVIMVAVFSVLYYKRHKKLNEKLKELTDDIQHTKWGLNITKEVITENHNTYTELDRIFKRFHLSKLCPELYKECNDLFAQQKITHSNRLLSNLTTLESNYLKEFQQKFPELSPEEILLAAMIKFGWVNSEIASLFHVSTEAARKRKDRLTNKIEEKIADRPNLKHFSLKT